ncbi:MAG: feruloyl-CoA synthase [Burkholderiaceae bacterium]|nr:feruloyl-CoA synthase [Burkholderiaceae bacterium]
MTTAPRYRAASVGGCLEATVDRRADGSVVLRSTEPLGWFPQRLTDSLEQWAAEAPDRTLVARRGPDGAWIRIGYAQMLQRVQAVAHGLLQHDLSPDRPLMVLSDNDIEHFTLLLAAMWVGVPCVPVSPAYSLVSQDYGKLRHIVQTATPGLVFARDAAYARAIDATVPSSVPVVLANDAAVGLVRSQGALTAHVVSSFEHMLQAQPSAAVVAAHGAVGPDTIAKILFTSGSTRMPKGVINTQRMLCANQQMLRQTLRFLGEEPPVLVDWLPWNHTFGGNHNIGIALYNGGTLYIDDGRPTPQGIAQTLENLREIAPTIYFNVPKGFEEIVHAMDTDEKLRARLFSRARAFMYAGAGLSQAVWDRLDAHGEAAVGERVRVITSLGMTETAPACTFAVGTDLRSGHVGLPLPGVEVKLVPDTSGSGKIEIRFRGPNVMPGYWRAPEQTAEAFDEEGYYRTGDAVRFVDEAEPQRGLLFDGRTAEDFKLSTGTFVSVGPLRGRVVMAGAPCVLDVVVTGLNRDEVGALVFPRLDACRALAGLAADVPAPDVLHHPKVRGFFQALADRMWREATGSASRVARWHVMAEPPSIDRGEITDKGSINQRAVLAHREALVEALYEGREADPFLILPSGFRP